MERSALDRGLKHSKRESGRRKISHELFRIGLFEMSFGSVMETMRSKHPKVMLVSNDRIGYC